MVAAKRGEKSAATPDTAIAPRVKPVAAWIAALVFGAAGVALLVQFNGSAFRASLAQNAWLAAGAAWLAYLIAARAAFWAYNRIDASQRTYFYVGLQLFRTLGYTFLFLTSFMGMALLLATAFARWAPYLTYRFTGQYKPRSYRTLLLIFFVVICIAGAPDHAGVFGLQFLAAAVWIVALAYRDIAPLERAVSGLSRLVGLRRGKAG